MELVKKMLGQKIKGVDDEEDLNEDLDDLEFDGNVDEEEEEEEN